MQTQHRIILGNSQQMIELEKGSVQLMVTSPPHPMIRMWDELFAKGNPKIALFFRELDITSNNEIVRQIYDAMHYYLSEVWAETYRVLQDGGIAA
jgi:DNA modification methylase